ncbi:hypothetical protein POM88_021525 [Heracleum sosnowskyi]|uniref:Pre-rRNA-processing protein Ipi1 N-terminal domain-containing protein n=1 Tax=Heracleum sosnowskyi TaxID=360622 RepID=A0AAD8MNY8_9APIA|nr:hypothetical protein POM88_021525 [Heracleum sosnowskyi]
MTNLEIDIRLMAFKFLDLVLQNCPTSFSLYAEKILQNYEDILRQNQFYLQDKAKLKSALVGITYCLSLLPHNQRGDALATDNSYVQASYDLRFRRLYRFEVLYDLSFV